MGFTAFAVVLGMAFCLLVYFLCFRGCSLVWSDEVLGLSSSYRVIWIDGTYGKNKTSLAYMLAYELMLHYGYKRLVSNVNSIWRDRPEDIVQDEKNRINAVVILDEGGLFIDTPAKAKKFKTALRKLNVVVITPSVEPPGGGMKFITVQRSQSYQFLGIPLLQFSWTLKKGNVKEKGTFFWWKPSGIYGIYATDRNPMHDAGIAGMLIKMAKTLDLRDDFLYSVDVLGLNDDEEVDEDQFGAVSQAAFSMVEASEEYSEAAATIVGTRRRR